MTVVDENALLKVLTVLVTESCLKTTNNDYMYEYISNRIRMLYEENLADDNKFVPLAEVIDFYMTPRFDRVTNTMVFSSDTRDEKLKKWFALNENDKKKRCDSIRKNRSKQKKHGNLKINVYPNSAGEFEIRFTLPDERTLNFSPSKLSTPFKIALIEESIKRALHGPSWYI